MSALDNSKIIASFVPEKDDGDTFIYTEMLDRTARKGNNGYRLVKTFYHSSQEKFWEQWETIRQLCDMTQVRAYTRLAPRSYERVGKEFTSLVVDAAMAGNWTHMKALYNSACGRVSPTKKLWLFDIDKITQETNDLADRFKEAGLLLARIPSKKGEHLITPAFDPRPYVEMKDLLPWRRYGEVSLHRDNPTNLYIPEGAA
jgi:hypothetical protein